MCKTCQIIYCAVEISFVDQGCSAPHESNRAPLFFDELELVHNVELLFFYAHQLVDHLCLCLPILPLLRHLQKHVECFSFSNVSGLHRFIIIDGVNRKFMLGLPENAGTQCSIGQAEFSLAAHR